MLICRTSIVKYAIKRSRSTTIYSYRTVSFAKTCQNHIYIHLYIYICVYIYVDLYIINPKSSSLRSSLLLRCAVLMRKSVGQCYLKFLIKNTGTYNHKALLSLISPIFGRVTLVLL